MPAPYLWIRDVDPQTHMRMLKLARARRKSLSETARHLINRYLTMDELPSTKETRIKAKIKVQRI